MRTYYYKISKSIVKTIYELVYFDGLETHCIYLTNGRLASYLEKKIQDHCDLMNDVFSSSVSHVPFFVVKKVINSDHSSFVQLLSEMRDN